MRRKRKKKPQNLKRKRKKETKVVFFYGKEESKMPGTAAKGTDRFNTSGPDHGCDAVVSARVASERALCVPAMGALGVPAVSARVQPYLPQPFEA